MFPLALKEALILFMGFSPNQAVGCMGGGGGQVIGASAFFSLHTSQVEKSDFLIL